MKNLVLILIVAFIVGCAASVPFFMNDSDSVTRTPRIQRPKIDNPVKAAPPPAPVALPEEKRTIKLIPKQKESFTQKPKADDVLDQLSLASMSVVIPERVNVDDSVNVELLIDLNATEKELEAQLTRDGAKFSSKIMVSKIVLAKITAPDFDIKTISDDRQALSEKELTRWAWTLTPKSVGSHEVYLTISAVVTVDNQRAERTIKTFDKTLIVEVTTKQQLVKFWNQSWEWLLSTLIIPLALWIWNSKKD